MTAESSESVSHRTGSTVSKIWIRHGGSGMTAEAIASISDRAVIPSETEATE